MPLYIIEKGKLNTFIYLILSLALLVGILIAEVIRVKSRNSVLESCLINAHIMLVNDSVRVATGYSHYVVVRDSTSAPNRQFRNRNHLNIAKTFDGYYYLEIPDSVWHHFLRPEISFDRTDQ